jgi:hypothetical protein
VPWKDGADAGPAGADVLGAADGGVDGDGVFGGVAGAVVLGAAMGWDVFW